MDMVMDMEVMEDTVVGMDSEGDLRSSSFCSSS